MMRCGWRLPAVAGVLFAASGAAGDGVMMPIRVGRATPMVASPRQEAVLATDGRTVQVILRTYFQKGPRELAWIVPVPAKVTRVDTADAGVFDRLHEIAAPRFYVASGKGGKGFGCGCSAVGQKGADSQRSVVVEASGTAGVFKYVVLGATDPAALTKWLNDHEYFVPPQAERLFKRYVDAGWHWLAMRIRPDAADKPTLAPHPIRYTYSDTKLVYPLAISQLSADLENEILLYVVANCRHACANWHNATIQPQAIRRRPGTPSGTDYEEVFRGVCAASGGHAFVTEWSAKQSLFGYADGRSGEINDVLDRGLIDALGSSQTVTRLRALMTPAAMDRDVTLVPTTWGPVYNEFHLSVATSPGGVLAAWAAILAAGGLLCAGLRLLGGRGWRRAGGVVCLAVACTAFSMI